MAGAWVLVTAVRGTALTSQAPMASRKASFLPQLQQRPTRSVNQGGKRKGSAVPTLRRGNNDIFEFLELRKNTATTAPDPRYEHGEWIPDLFMKRMEPASIGRFSAPTGKDLHELYGKAFEKRYRIRAARRAGKIQGQKIEALELWKKMLSMLFETGHRGHIQGACNIVSAGPLRVIHSPNSCTESPQYVERRDGGLQPGSVILETLWIRTARLTTQSLVRNHPHGG